MKVYWSSTYKILHRAELFKEVSDVGLILPLLSFVYEMGLAEKEHSKHSSIDALQLSSEEWNCVYLFLNLLSVSVLSIPDQ